VFGMLAASFFGIKAYLNRNVWANLGDCTISKKLHAETVQSFKALYEKNNNPKNNTFYEDETKKLLITNCALKIEAKKNGVSFDENSINNYLKDGNQLPPYVSTADYKSAAKNNFGWNDEQANLRLVNDYLEKTLRDKLIKTKNLSWIFIRWDNFTNGDKEALSDQDKKYILDKIEKENIPLLKSKAPREELANSTDVSDAYSNERNNLAQGVPIGVSNYHY
jgi:hypothetical protein